MIDKINGQKYFEYAKINQEKRKNVDSSEFYMNLEKQGVIYEKNEDRKKSSETEVKQEIPKASAGNATSGVKVEISHQGQEKARQSELRKNVSEQIRKFAQNAVTFLKFLWDKIWNEPAEKENVEFPEVLEERMKEAEDGQQEYPFMEAERIPGEYLLQGPVSDTQPVYTREEIRAIFRRGDRTEIENFLSDNGKRHLVKNSDLLTQYDKKGMIVGDRSDKELILHGNRNEIKL